MKFKAFFVLAMDECHRRAFLWMDTKNLYVNHLIR